MAMFVHLTPEKNAKRIKRAGIKPTTWSRTLPDGVFAMPVTANFYISHQWLRELKSSGQRTLCGIYFRVPDDEPVYIDHFNANHSLTTAGDAVDLIMQQESAEGYEVVIPRKITRKEIHKIRRLPQNLGWRYAPDSRSRPYCACPVCAQPGTVRSKIKNRKWEAQF